jgi:hypothetical protein
MVLEKNGEIVSPAPVPRRMGSPVNAVAWLANTLGRWASAQGRRVILSGSLAAGPGQGRRQPARGHRRHRRLLGQIRLTDVPSRNIENEQEDQMRADRPGNIGTDLLYKAATQPGARAGVDGRHRPLPPKA